MNNHK